MERRFADAFTRIGSAEAEVKPRRWRACWSGSNAFVKTVRRQPAYTMHNGSTPRNTLRAGLQCQTQEHRVHRLSSRARPTAVAEVHRPEALGGGAHDRRVGASGRRVDRAGRRRRWSSTRRAKSSKQGKASSAWARQWCGRAGKVDNCQVGVYMAYVARDEQAFGRCEVVLAKEWTKDRRRCRQVGIPGKSSFTTRHEACPWK